MRRGVFFVYAAEKIERSSWRFGVWRFRSTPKDRVAIDAAGSSARRLRVRGRAAWAGARRARSPARASPVLLDVHQIERGPRFVPTDQPGFWESQGCRPRLRASQPATPRRPPAPAEYVRGWIRASGSVTSESRCILAIDSPAS